MQVQIQSSSSMNSAISSTRHRSLATSKSTWCECWHRSSVRSYVGQRQDSRMASKKKKKSWQDFLTSESSWCPWALRREPQVPRKESRIFCISNLTIAESGGATQYGAGAQHLYNTYLGDPSMSQDTCWVLGLKHWLKCIPCSQEA